MRRLSLFALFTLTASLVLSARGAGQNAKFPAPGSLVPGSFQPFNLNGKKGQDRHHCLVCEFGLNPVVMVLAKEGPDGDDPILPKLLEQLDQAVDRHEDHLLRAFAVVLSPSAKSSISQPKIEVTAELLEEAQQREKLTNRLLPLAKKLKNVVVGYFPEEGPKGYNVPAPPGVTVVLYYKHRVEASHHFEHGKMQPEQVTQVLKNIDEMIQKNRKK